jgi:uncharacterized protein (DUF305 family)
MIPRRIVAAAAGISLSVMALTGCAPSQPDAGRTASPSPTQSPTDSGFNDQDVMFAQMMIPHHAQAVDMAEMILAKDDINPQVTELAEQIRDAQGPEIELMTSWLEGWGESVEGSGHSAHGMEGMMSEDDMQALEDATGDDAARLFLDQMTAHHMGAISMAETEIERGENADATALAQKIVDDQRAEIDTMSELRSSL